ncbi:acetylornithine aminotransferase [Actinomycetospora sp. NBRC 106375]|uniref:acetylornithine transaminase n=1 Tax=Actinomycetospora sp. NBRC 106375 TaxID=3032207 RepID=UPI0024A2EB7C|nr:acetylornithine transaminase [Actinomycetospora sp. NBRC 106375]GLZ50315.1 acetylornithine aminotransferase [Actinomycetospora sp. NBRC 106375]
MTVTSEDLRSRWVGSFMDNYGTPPISLVRGEGAVVWDADGREYLDLLGGIAVNFLGHAHPAIVEAVSRQVATLGHTSNLVINPVAVELAERLLGLLGHEGRVLLCNSGAEANEAALKITRRTGRTKVIATEGGFHGRTMGALALTGQPAKREPFEPLVPGVEFVPYGDADALRAAVDDETAAVFLEPIQGEAGVIVPPEGYLQAAREITTEHGALLVLDEVQTGTGRTGVWFAHQRAGITPDVVTLAKGLGGGLPIGACIGVGPAGDLLGPGQHGTTFGGNPIACAAALAVLDTIVADGLLDRAEEIGKDLGRRLGELDHPLVDGVDAAGLLVGVALREPVSTQVTAAARDAGYLINNAVPGRLRLAPPAVVTDAQLDGFVAALPEVLDQGAAAAEAAGS